MSIIEVQSLSRCYGRHKALDGVSFAVPEGSIFGFLGPNGAGKTTAIRILLGLLAPTGGRATVLGLDCWRASHRIKAEVGYLPGDLRLYPSFTGLETLRIFAKVRRRNVDRNGRELAEKFALDLNLKVRHMSRGMRQKLGLILALAHQPRLLILDEPTSALDPLVQEILHQHLRSVAADGGTVFFSSHQLGEVEQLCDRAAIIRNGELVADESLKSLQRKAGRQVTIRWTNASDAERTEPPPFLALQKRETRVWTGLLDGPIVQFVDWLAGQTIDDLEIGHPDLEILFRRYYEQDTQEP